MKTATIPSLRVDPELRKAAEEVLQDGESLSNFVETSLRANIARREAQREFVARGLAAREQAHASGKYHAAGKVLDELDHMLATAKRPGKRA